MKTEAFIASSPVWFYHVAKHWLIDTPKTEEIQNVDAKTAPEAMQETERVLYYEMTAQRKSK